MKDEADATIAIRRSLEFQLAIDTALARGITVEGPDGEQWELRPLALGDMADLSMLARSRALRAYEQAHTNGEMTVQRQIDINAILFGSNAVDLTRLLNDPFIMVQAVKKSIRKANPGAKDDEIEQLLEDEATAERLIDRATALLVGPRMPEDIKESAEKSPDPTTDPAVPHHAGTQQ